jgi:DNA-binding MarR family transcriptional regulator
MKDADAVDEILAQWRAVRPDLDLRAMGIIGRLGRVALLVQRAVEAELQRHGLSVGEFDVLAALRRAGKPHRLTPTQLYRTLMLTSGAMTNRIDRLEERGLVERHEDPSDRRGTLVGLTAQGLRVVDAAVTGHVDNEARILAGLSKGELAALEGLLRRVEAGLAKSRDGKAP